MALKNWLSWGSVEEKPTKVAAFPSERAVYDFCRSVYNDSKGPTPELRKAYELYKKKTNAEIPTSSAGSNAR